MPAPDQVGAAIRAGISGAQVEVEDLTGGGDHFRVSVTSPEFAGLSRLEQHRRVYAAVESELASGAIHALSIATAVPDPNEGDAAQ